MSVRVTTNKDYLNFGSCVHIENDIIELYATTEFGPRIIHFGFKGEPNLLWADTERIASFQNDALEEAFHKGDTYHVYGGHRLLCSPEDTIKTFYPDNDPVTVILSETGCLLTAPVQESTALQFSMQIRMAPDAARLSVRHKIQNMSEEYMVDLAPWAVTQLAPGGLELFPLPKQDTGALPDRVLVLWPYTDMGDTRVTWGDDHVALRHDPDIDRYFKLGLHNRLGYAFYSNNGTVFKKNFNALPKAGYPDFGCSFETFICKQCLEMETLAPISTLFAGQSATHEEEWSCYRESETLDADALIRKYGQ